jgi:hypothetical protein
MAPHSTRAFVSTESALKLFKVSSASSLRELNRAYRRLVRKYHPDYNPARLDWAHDAMVRINAAYDVAVAYLSSVQYEEVQAHLDREIQAHDEFSSVFTIVANRVLDGIFTYYQYGLDNPHQRQSGTPRTRYRRAVRGITAAFDQLERLQVPNKVDGQTLDTFATFTRTFLKCMQLGRTYVPSSSRLETLAYRRYYEGTRALDASIRRGFFRDQLSPHRELASPQALTVSLHEFMAVVTNYGASTWITETALRLRLLDAFQDVLALSDRFEALGL